MNNRFLADIQIIKNAINTNKLVIFAGAGISIDANVPSWSVLISSIKEDLDLPADEEDFLKIAQIYFNERQEKEYIEKVRNILGHKKLRYNEIHEEIFELNPEHILTTNFDNLLEQVVSKESLPYSIIKEDKDLPYSNNTKLLVKIHGDLDLGNIVFKEDDYLGYQQNHPLLDSFIKSIFSTKIVLFIGYSFNDYNLKQIVQYVRNVLGRNFQNAYLLSVDENMNISHKQYLKNKGINVVNYYEADYKPKIGKKEEIRNYILDFLKEENIYGSKSKYFKEVSSLSDKGKLLLNFLRFIRFYDKLKITLNESNVVDQLYNSLIRFDELKVLPQDFISKLYPFKSAPEPESLLEFTTLLLKNKHLVNLFFKKIKINTSKIELIDIDEEKKEKVEFILKKLNRSVIFSVSKENTTPDSRGFRGFSPKTEDRKEIECTSNYSCNCTKCKFINNNLKESFIETNSYTVGDTTSIHEDMQKAFLNYKFGNYFQAIKMFEEIATKAWRAEKFIIYYIAKINMKSLKTFLFNESLIEKEEKDSVGRKIDDIDIDKLIFQIPYKSDDEYALLKIIRDDKVLMNAKEWIDIYFDKIVENYKFFQNPYSNVIDAYYPKWIYLEVYKLLSFYNENYIIRDEFDDFRALINKAVEGFLISFATPDRYGGKIREFSESFFKLIIPYVNPERFNKVVEEYDIKELKFEDGKIDELLEYFNNFLTSFIERDNLFNTYYKSKILEGQLSIYWFESKIKRVFNNILIVLSLLELNKVQFGFIKNKLLAFLLFDTGINNKSPKLLNSFFRRNSQNISFEDAKKLLEIYLGRISKNNRFQILDMIADVCIKNDYYLLDDIEIAKRTLSEIELNGVKADSIIKLWLISNEEVKKYYHKIIIERLNNQFDVRLFKEASLAAVIDPDLYFDKYVSYLNDKNDGLKPGYSIQDGKPKLHSFLLHNELLFLYRIGIRGREQKLEEIENLPEYAKFGLLRDKYDFLKFKIEWIYIFNNEDFMAELKKIKPLKGIIEAALKENYDEELATIYTKYFL